MPKKAKQAIFEGGPDYLAFGVTIQLLITFGFVFFWGTGRFLITIPKAFAFCIGLFLAYLFVRNKFIFWNIYEDGIRIFYPLRIKNRKANISFLRMDSIVHDSSKESNYSGKFYLALNTEYSQFVIPIKRSKKHFQRFKSFFISKGVKFIEK